MEDIGTIGVGCVIGVVVIALVNAFPGEPFDYDKGPVALDSCSNQPCEHGTTSEPLEARIRDVDISVSQLKVHKLQQLLGLEKHEVQKMIDSAKADAISGRQPRATANYTRRLDMAFYTLMGGLIVIVLRTEYSLDILQFLTDMFPREAETVRKVAAIMPTHLLTK